VEFGREIGNRIALVRRDLGEIVETGSDRARVESIELALERDIDRRVLAADTHGAVKRIQSDPGLAVEDRVRDGEGAVGGAEAVLQIEQDIDVIAAVLGAAQADPR